MEIWYLAWLGLIDLPVGQFFNESNKARDYSIKPVRWVSDREWESGGDGERSWERKSEKEREKECERKREKVVEMERERVRKKERKREREIESGGDKERKRWERER